MLFNRVLARRVSEGSWRRAMPGEALMLDGSNSVFNQPQADADIDARLSAMDLHPTGPMWGDGDPIASGEALALEQSVLSGCGEWCDGLGAAGLKSARRALRVPLADLDVVLEDSHRLTVSFALPAGAYATMAVRELIDGDPV